MQCFAASPVRHPLQTGATMLRRLALVTITVVVVAALYGITERRVPHSHIFDSGLFVFEWLMLCPLTALLLVAFVGRARASDCEIGPTGFRIFGGAYDQLQITWRSIRIEGTTLAFGKLTLDLGSGVTIRIATASVESEVQSLHSLLDTMIFHHKHASVEAAATADQSRLVGNPEILRCSRCGAPALVDDLPEVSCGACGEGVPVSPSLRERLAAARTLGRHQRAVTALIQRALRQPNAKRINQLLIGVAATGIVWLPVPVIFGAMPEAAVGCVLFVIAFLTAFVMIENRRALTILIANCAAHRVAEAYRCCGCGAPLPRGDDSVVVRACIYCQTDNILGFDWVVEAQTTAQARSTLTAAYTQHLRAICKARRFAAIACLATAGGLFFAYGSGKPITSPSAPVVESPYSTHCVGSRCTFAGLEGNSRATFEALGKKNVDVTVVVTPNARLGELGEVSSLARVTEIVIPLSREPLVPKTFASFHFLTNLDVEATNMASVDPLAGLPLRQLRLVSAATAPDYRALGTLLQLTDLNLRGSTFEDLEALAPLRALSRLDLSETPLSSLSGIDDLTALSRFDCQLCRSLTSLAPLSGHPTLEELDLSGAGLTTLNTIQGIPGLQILRIANNGIDDLEPLRQFSELHELDLRGNPIKSLEPLGQLKKLTRLTVNTGSLAHLHELFALTSLQQLDVQSGISSDDQAALRKALPRTQLRTF